MLRQVTRLNSDRMPKVMLNYRPTGRRRFGRPLKRLLDETGADLSRPNWWRIIIIIIIIIIINYYYLYCRSQWPRGLRRWSAAARFMGLRIWIPPGAWKSVSCECCVLSVICLCAGLITRPEESYRVWYIWVWSWRLNNEKALAH